MGGCATNVQNIAILGRRCPIAFDLLVALQQVGQLGNDFPHPSCLYVPYIPGVTTVDKR